MEPRLNLSNKIILILLLTLVTVLTIGFYLIIQVETKKLFQEMKQKSLTISQIVQRSVGSVVSDIRKNKKYLQSLTERLGKLESVVHVEVFNRSAVVVAHSKKERIGGVPDIFHVASIKKVFASGEAVGEIDFTYNLYNRFLPIKFTGEDGKEEVVGVVELVMELRPDLEVMIKDAKTIAEIVQESVGHVFFMIQAKKDYLQLLTGQLGEIREVNHIEVYDTRARIIAHTDRKKVGASPSPSHVVYVKNIMKTGIPLDEDDPESGRFTRFVPILEFTGRSDGEIAGVVELVMDRNQMVEKATALREKMIITATVLIAVILAVLTLFLRKFIVLPILRLSELTKLVAKGDLTQSVKTGSRDELGELAESFNKMTGDLKKSRDELVAAKDYTDNIILSMVESLIVCSMEGNILVMNDSAMALLGYSGNELIGTPISSLFAESDHPFAGPGLKELKEKGSIENVEKTFLGKNGRKIPVSCSGSIIRGDYGEIQGIVCVAHDITERKEAQKALSESEQKHRNLFEYANDSIFIIDPETGNFLDVNQNAAQRLGYTREELLKLSVADINPNLSEEVIKERFESQLAGASITFEIEHKRKDGSNMPAEISSRLFDYGGKKVFQAFARDITERKKAETELLEAKHGAEEANKAKTRFLAKANHELRGPLTSILGMLKLILDGRCKDREEEKSFLKDVYTSSMHLRGLIENLLNLSVIETGKIKTNMRMAPISEILERVRQITWMQAKEKNLTLDASCECKGGMHMIYCDPNRLREVLVNLAGNAIKFTETGSVEIRCDCVTGDEKVEIEVIDTGIGIAPENLETIFEPFEQVDTHKHGGTGLGLAVAKKFVEGMDGILTAQSDGLGKGSRFIVTLPSSPP